MADIAEHLTTFLTAWEASSATRGVTTSLQPPVRPYPVFAASRLPKSELFFGRRTHVEQLGRRFKDNNVVIVIGGSGSGKSSLVKAGLLPNLKTVAPVPKRRGKWYVAECRPRTDPGAEMLDALWRDVCAPLLSTETGQEALAAGFSCASPSSRNKTELEELCKSRFYTLVSGPARGLRARSVQPYGIYEFANTVLDRIDYSLLEGLRSGAANLLILLDQFEEIFDDDKIDSVDRDEIVSLIELARSNRDQGLFLVLTMRSEALTSLRRDRL